MVSIILRTGPTLTASGYRKLSWGWTDRGRNNSRAVALSWATSALGVRRTKWLREANIHFTNRSLGPSCLPTKFCFKLPLCNRLNRLALRDQDTEQLTSMVSVPR